MERFCAWQQIYTTRGTTPLQNFQYAYDSNANITTIHDYIMGSPQTQSFGYDNLDRLTSAGAANGTQGNYGPEGYTYDAATGNLATKNGSAYNYGPQSTGCVDGALDKAHAAVSAGGNNYCYDKNGNMVRRVIGGVTYTLTYDTENHMTGYSGGGVNATFVYDGDGRRVQSTVNGVTTQFVGSHVEWKTSTTDMVRYYYAGGVRVAMRTGDAGLVWLVGDHLGSTNIAVTDSSGATERQGYKAWGETRFGSLSTKCQYTGQRNEPEIGLYYYGARWYDSSLSRFAQPDTIIPGLSQGILAWDRYQFVNSNPLKYTDPTGHQICSDNYCGVPQTPLQERLENSSIEELILMIKRHFGIVMVNSDTMTWSKDNLITAFNALRAVNDVLNGALKSLVNGFQFIINGGGQDYRGQTSYQTVNFYVAGKATDIPLINFLHETGHLLDSSLPGLKNAFSSQIGGAPTWVKDGYVDRDILLDKFREPVQAKPLGEDYDPDEYWADAFANYVAGNIDLSEDAGRDMADFVSKALSPYTY